jgi:hypothetical protein
MRTSFDEWLWSKVLQRQVSPFWQRVGRWLNRPYADAFPVISRRQRMPLNATEMAGIAIAILALALAAIVWFGT